MASARVHELIARHPWDVVMSFVERNAPDKPRDGTIILELGCGIGNNIAALARDGYLVTGVDNDPEMLDRARAFLGEQGFDPPRVNLDCLDMRKLDYPDASFDLAFDRGSLTYVDPVGAVGVMWELMRVVKPGGRVLLTPFRVSSEPDVYVWSRGGVGVLTEDWNLLQLQRVDVVDELAGDIAHSEWRIVVERPA